MLQWKMEKNTFVLPNLWRKHGQSLHVKMCLRMALLEHGIPSCCFGQHLVSIRVRRSRHVEAWGDSSPISERFLKTFSPSHPLWKKENVLWHNMFCHCKTYQQWVVGNYEHQSRQPFRQLHTYIVWIRILIIP